MKTIKRTQENTKDVEALNFYSQKLKECNKRNDKVGAKFWSEKIQFLPFK
jgi:hypothetical protein